MNRDQGEIRRVGVALRAATNDYDWVIVDCPSSLDVLTEIAFWSTSELVIPIRCEYFAMEGMAQLIQLVKKAINCPECQLQFSGIVLTMYEDSLETARAVDNEVRDFFGDITYQTVMPRDAAVPAAQHDQRSVLEFAPRSRGARAYVELCMEVLERD